MIDGLTAFYRSGFDAQVYCLCVGGFAAIGINRLRRSADFNNFIRRLANQLALLTVLAGIGLLIVASIRYVGGCLESPDCSMVRQMEFSVALTFAGIVSIGPLIYLSIISRQSFRIEPLEEEKAILLLPAPETFADKGTAP